MGRFYALAVLSLLLGPAVITAQSNTYDYIVVGSGPGGGPLAANLAKAGASVLLLEAGDDQSKNLHQEIPSNFYLSYTDPAQRWDFFVKYHSDDTITNEYIHLTWRTVEGKFYVGTEPPAGATMLGVYYPRAGTLGGCSTHNAMAAVLPPDSDWQYIANITGDNSWSPATMAKYFAKIENNHYVPLGTPGHGFDGYLDIRYNDAQTLKNQSEFVQVLEATAKASDQDPSQLLDQILMKRDLNSPSGLRDYETGLFGFPSHIDTQGRRVTAGKPVLNVVGAKNPDGSKKYDLTLKVHSLVTKVLFDTTGKNLKLPRATGIEFLVGQSLYGADPRYNASTQGTKQQAFARKEVILSAGVFNSPQILKLSGIGPKAELKKFNIPVLVDLPGVGSNLQDNNEIAVIANAATDFVNKDPPCGNQNASDPCLAQWYEGKGPYTYSTSDALLYKSTHSINSERDILLWASPGIYRGYWPAETVNQVPFDPPNTFGFSMLKIHPQTNAGTVSLRSADPREVPDINFRFWEGNDEGADADLEAMVEGINFGRKIFDSVGAPLGPFKENFPCGGARNCDVKEVVRKQTWSHHATSTCAIGRDNDPLAVLDSRFRVRGTAGLRVVDGSAFPKTPGSFPVLPTFILSEKATAVILEDSWH